MSDERDLDLELAAIQSGDARAFARWMAGAEPPLRAGLRSFATRVDAEAIVQETLLRVWQVAPRFTPDGRPHGLLRMAHRIARNLAVSELRRHGAREVELVVDPPSAPEPPDPLLRSVIEKCREKLPPKPAEALDARLASAGGEPDLLLAEQLGLTKNTFLQSFGRARKLLLACLQKHGVVLAEVLK